MNQRGVETGRRMGWLASLGVAGAATAAAMALMFWTRNAFQIRTLPERVMEWVLLFVSPDTLERGSASSASRPRCTPSTTPSGAWR